MSRQHEHPKWNGESYNRIDGWRVLTVTYFREDGNLVTTRTGYGQTYPEALADADAQLRPGVWTRRVVSQPSSILTDLKNGGRRRKPSRRYRRGEGETVVIAEPLVRRP